MLLQIEVFYLKIHKLNCPNCNGSLEMEIAEGTSSVFCPYCGQKFLLDDERKEYTLNINKTIHKRYTNDSEIIKAKLKDKENKRSWIALLICAIIAIGIPFGMMFKYEIEEKIAINEGKINAGYYLDLIGEDYKTVEAHFKSAGFTNIELVDLNDSGVAFWKDGEVSTISVGGNTNFDSIDWFETNTKVVISYH